MQGCAKIQLWPVAAALLGALVAAGLPAAGADEPDPPSVPLDRLLKLPSSAPVQARVEKRGGNTRSQWQARFEKARAGDVRHSLADITKAREFLGFRPRFGIEEGLRLTVDWLQRRK